ncbi:HsdR family type I site-specific deoxyribonuclease [Hymenobacter gummosus]|uniref:Type I restriction enzyme endonuclease subunit n=1 Tax=Hymenobacter gummosus TaxID=1776032 RepID=A0A431U6L6_9BACT|nr:HsdR family type I site-specific deoxyribonuclease [Hymenobacter gummosus]RTQ52315.1 HsdR family type I site-specific deoxyribonuclease [Hymenobacter gummosus]
MSAKVGQVERATQDRVVRLFHTELGYEYLGNWEKQPRRSPIEDGLVRRYLEGPGGYAPALVDKVLRELHLVAENHTEKLYKRNRELYRLLRYGVKVRPALGEKKVTVHLVNWQDPTANDFAVAEEVTVEGTHIKRPDVVLYLNGLAVGVLELKRSKVSVHEGIRQNLDNQTSHFIQDFFGPVQLVLAGNDTEGLRYGTVGTTEKYYLEWREETAPAVPRGAAPQGVEEPVPAMLTGASPPGPLHSLDARHENGEGEPVPTAGKPVAPAPLRLDEHLRQLCRKERLLTLLHDFVVFDRGIKKLCRPNQFFGVTAAQAYLKRKEGGIIWHTQGSGKSLTMVWLTKWLLEHDANARVLIVTDRDELDEQIEKVFRGVELDIERAKSGADLLEKLSQAAPRLLCSLVHKFGARTEAEAYDKYLEELMKAAGRTGQAFRPQGQLYVLVDECHRTQSGKLHEAMKLLLPGAVLIGFTGTPLLQADKRTTLETFGPFIHTYRVNEAVRDGVVLELRYEARQVEQYLTEAGKKKMDEYFELKTKGLNEFGRARLKEKWGTMQQVLSSKERMGHIVADIMLDMEKKERLRNGRGNALLVSGSIYQACRYYELFQQAGFRQCAIVTSYQPKTSDLKGETTGEGDTEQLQKYKIYNDMLAGQPVEDFEKEVKRQFVEEPAQMKLLIVVDKLLTGFDAPSATYLYIDKQMRDHTLFQAICRVNRLDGEDKEYGYVVDYKDLFKALEKSIRDYTSEALDGYSKEDVQDLLNDRLTKGHEELEGLREQLRLLCEPVAPPRGTAEYLHFFCGNPALPADLKEREGRRRELYKYTAALLRTYAELAGELEEAGYTPTQAAEVQRVVQHYENVRDEVKTASGEAPDLKRYEADMRFIFDNYVKAEDSEKVGELDDMSLIELVVAQGPAAAVSRLPKGIRGDKNAVAETIENNVRRLIIDENPTNPKYFGRMSVLLEELIARRQQEAIEYEAYLQEIAALCKLVQHPGAATTYPPTLHTLAQRSLYDNLGQDETLALAVDAAIQGTAQNGWKDDDRKKKMVRLALKKTLPDPDDIDRILQLATQQAEY